MDPRWIGKDISLDLGDMGVFQGVITATDLDEQNLTIADVFRNGKRSEMSSLTIR